MAVRPIDVSTNPLVQFGSVLNESYDPVREALRVPTWQEVRDRYPYAPGRPETSEEAMALQEKRAARQAELQERREARQKELDERRAERERRNSLISKRSQLPDRNKWWDVVSHVERPQNKTQFAEAFLHDFGESVGNGILSLFGWNSDDGEEGEFNPWEQEYLAWKNGGGAGGGAYDPLAGTPFPSIGGYSPDWKTLREAANIEAPKYHEKAFNPMNTVANMLMNMDWINMDMSRAGKIMQDAFNRRADDNANVANKNEEAKYQAARDKLNTALAFEKLKAEQAQQAAALAIKRWEAMQPKALGGNKMYWRDSNGGLHFEAVDKQGEARTLGGNEALAMLMDKSPKELKKMTYNDLVKLAKTRGSIWLQDKASYVPWMQGFILQAQMMKNSDMRGEK